MPSLPRPLSRLGLRAVKRLVLDPGLPWEQQRSRLAVADRFSQVPAEVEVSTDEIGGLLVERVAGRAATTEAPVMVHLHGGGFCVGSPAVGRAWAAATAVATGATVLLPDYPLAPEQPFPAAADALDKLWSAVSDGRDPSRSIVLGGDSAGANLALGLALRERDAGRALPAGLILISPWLDLSADRAADPRLARRDPMLRPDWLAACAAAYTGDSGVALDDPAVSPLHADLSGLPPVLVQAGSDDVLVPDPKRFVARVTAAGGDARLTLGERLWHDFPLQAGTLAAADSTTRQTAAFIEERTAG